METLIITDNAACCDLILTELAGSAWTPTVVESLEAAQQALPTCDFQVIILDWLLVDAAGKPLAGPILRAGRGRQAHLIALLSREHHRDIACVLACGADDCLFSPPAPIEIKTRLMVAAHKIASEASRLTGQAPDTAPGEAASVSEIESPGLCQPACRARLEENNTHLEAALKRVEEIETLMLHSEKMAAIGQLAAGVAHEINNPTGFVSSNLRSFQDYQGHIETLIAKYRDLCRQILRSSHGRETIGLLKACARKITAFEKEIDIDFLLEDIADLINDCRVGTDRIKKIVWDLKEFAHPGDDTVRSIDINGCLEATLNVAFNELKYKAVVEKDYGKLPPVRGYPQQLNQVFMNILINAAQAIERRGTIRLKTQMAHPYVRIDISDTGCGIPRNQLPLVFKPFFTTKEVGKGTGLGMSIAHNIVKNHQGTIRVASTVGEGTTFTIRLPVEVEGGAD